MTTKNKVLLEKSFRTIEIRNNKIKSLSEEIDLMTTDYNDSLRANHNCEVKRKNISDQLRNSREENTILRADIRKLKDIIRTNDDVFNRMKNEHRILIKTLDKLTN